jgi:hypothetical protein
VFLIMIIEHECWFERLVKVQLLLDFYSMQLIYLCNNKNYWYQPFALYLYYYYLLLVLLLLLLLFSCVRFTA